MKRFARIIRMLMISGIFSLLIFITGAQAVHAGATLTVNSTEDNAIADNRLTFREAVMLAAGSMNRALTMAETGQVSGACFVAAPPSPEGGPAPGWIISPPNPANSCPNIGREFSDNIVFDPSVDVIDFREQGEPLRNTLYLQVGCNDHINGNLGDGRKATLRGNGTNFSAALWLTSGMCSKRGDTTSNNVRNLIIRGFNSDAIVGEGVNKAVFEGLELFENGANGIYLFQFVYDDGSIVNSVNNRIGGPEPSQRNFIHSNGRSGIVLSGNPSISSPANNWLVNNFIGLKSTSSTEASGNLEHGIIITDMQGTTVGGLQLREGNIIVGNEKDGIRIEGSNSARNMILSNSVGVAGAVRMGNRLSGIVIAGGAMGNQVSSNFIGANRTGVTLAGRGTSGNVVMSNFIGTNREGRDLGNVTDGVTIMGGSNNNVIGNRLTNDGGGNGNTIAFNGNDGVQIIEGSQNLMLSNSISKNRGGGIDLSPEGVNLNDPGDPDPGPNELQNAPTITSVTIIPNGTDYSVNVVWEINSTPGRSFRVQFFGNAECDNRLGAEGETFLGSTRVGTNSSGVLSTTNTFTVKSIPSFISSTATDESNSNTSEFSNCMGTGQGGGGGSGGGTNIGVGPPGRIVRDDNIVVVRPPGVELSRADLKISINATPTLGMEGISLSYNITVTNNGPSEAREVVVSDDLPEPLVFASCVSNGECGGAGNNRTVRFASLAPNSSATMTIIARVKTIAPGMQVNNTVRVSSQTPDPNPNNNTATATSTAPRLPF